MVNKYYLIFSQYFSQKLWIFSPTASTADNTTEKKEPKMLKWEPLLTSISTAPKLQDCYKFAAELNQISDSEIA
jgi:hypothetical protein